MACVVWLTGLSGAGKSSIAQVLVDSLNIRGNVVEWLDGDDIRKIFPSTGFDETSRIEHIKRVGFTASLLERHGVTVIVSLISPHRTARGFSRMLCQHFVEVYVDCPFEECAKRDPKGLYKKALSGEIENFTGLDARYDPPEKPEIRIDTTQVNNYTGAEIILNYLIEHKLINGQIPQ